MGGIEEKIFAVKPTDKAVELAHKYGYSPWIVERYLRMLPEEEVYLLLEANEKPLKKSIRCNDYLIKCGELKERLGKKGVILRKIPFTRHGYYVERGSDKIGYLHEYMLGYYYIQGPASMIPVEILDPRPGEDVLDAAAAPGGKSTQILQHTKDKAHLLAIDKNRERIKSLRSHLSRMGFNNHIIIRMDNLKLPTEYQFDKILLDAPCSGEGIIRKDPSRKKSRTIEDLKYLSSLQIRMVSHLSRLIRENGVMVYSTCTIGVEENEYVLTKALEHNPCLEPVDTEAPGSRGLTSYSGVEFDPRLERCRRILPHQLNTEGFFICKLRRKC